MMIIDSTGATVAQYKYDVYGKVESVNTYNGNNIGTINPLRYRGYCYDNEGGLYYLISRYYDPTTGRFVNADDTAYLGSSGTVTSFNLYSYCENNPMNKIDSTGTDAILLQNFDGAYGLGHTSLLIQEAPGKWWYFYWGNDDIQLLYFGKGDVDVLNSFLHGNNNYFYEGQSYEKRGWKRIKGGFRYCLDYIYKEIMGSPKGKNRVSFSFKYYYKNRNKYYINFSYNLLNLNCVQTSMHILLQGKFSNAHLYKYSLLVNARLKTAIPNDVYWFLYARGFLLIKKRGFWLE